MPEATLSEPAAPQRSEDADAEPSVYHVSAESLIPLAFHLNPDIKSSYERFVEEAARYDFFYSSRDSLTPRLSVGSNLARSVEPDGPGAPNVRSRRTDMVLEAAVEKRFFDTTRVEVGTGYDIGREDGQSGQQPLLFANARVPLWGSRERLSRASEDIFRQNELDDAQLDYIDRVRRILNRALEQYYQGIELEERTLAGERWSSDLDTLLRELEAAGEDERAADLSRVRAESVRAAAAVRNSRGRYEIELARLKSVLGVPYESTIELLKDPFNPFAGQTHEEILVAAIANDPESATLANAAANARVQLDLARRGKWDVALSLSGIGRSQGDGTLEGEASWSAFAGVDISLVDQRVTASLTDQAEASIRRSNHAIAARGREIHVDTLDPIVRIRTLTPSHTELVETLPRYQEDYASGLAEYRAGNLNIDDLLNRRSTLFRQEEQVAEFWNSIGVNVAELCAATGKFFEILEGFEGGE